VSFGVCGLALVLWLLAPLSVKLGTFSALSTICSVKKLLTGSCSAFKYCCRARGEKLEKSKIFYGCLAKVVRDGGFKIALIARLSAIPGHCMRFSLLRLFILNRASSYYRCLFNLWNGHPSIFFGRYSFNAKAAYHCISWRYLGE